ncbi:Ig-like domain-containing protein [Leyella stercorea]|uniref:Ig-like domain-containing protein n=1 Tax=Leyella stercorea TaxID=363265 RepID=UPI00266CE9D5|nr:Ig-like domain-containing protein [Leyella stercorea]
MIKHLRFFMLNLLVLVSAAVMAQNEAVWKSLTFPDENKNNNKCQNYTTTWTAKIGDTTWSVSNFNNNKWSWKHIRCGRKNNNSVASIMNDAAFTEAVTKVVVKISEAKQLDKVNSVNLVVAKDKACKDIVETVAGIETVAGSFGKETTFADDLTFNITAPAKNLFYKLVIDMKGGSENGFIHVDAVNYYAGTSDTSTSLTFGADVDGKTFTVRQGDSFADKTATVTPTDAKGSISYASDNEEAISVNATTGAVSFLAFGKATITATFNAGEGYLDSEASYTIDYRQAADPTKVLFDTNEGAFDSFGNENGYKDGEFDFVDLNGDSYTFTVHNAMLNNHGGGLQLKKASTSDATAQGYAVSPTFSKFPYGYRVTVKYKDQNAPELKCVNYSEKVAVTDDANGTITMDVPFADGTFKLLGGSQVAYVQSIELTPLAKKEATTMTFPQKEYTLNIGEDFTAPKATVKGEDGKNIEGLTLLYTSDNEDIALVDNTGEVLLGDKAGTAVITAYFHGNETYKPCQASYKINLTKKQPQPVTMTFPQEVYTCYTDKAQYFDGFKATIKNEAGEELNLPVTYSSSNTEFCMVTGSGLVVLSETPGEVTITAKFAGNADYLPAQASYVIKVIKKEKKDAGISFEDTMIMIDLANPNTTVKDLGFLNPNNLSVTYSSNKTDVAEVDAEGNVTLKKAGRANIDVTFAGNDEYKAASASCTLIVNDYRTTPELSFDQEEYTANMREGNTFSGATLYNELEVAPLSYTSSNEEVAEVAANGVVILRSTGETTITVWFAGDKNFKAASASYKLKVVDEVVDGIQGITIDNMPEDAKVYNLNGQRVNTKALKSGVYVVNGKKVVLK